MLEYRVVCKGGSLDLDALINEILMLDSCHDPNIVNYLCSYMYKEQVWVVMEYLDGGSVSLSLLLLLL